MFRFQCLSGMLLSLCPACCCYLNMRVFCMCFLLFYLWAFFFFLCHLRLSHEIRRQQRDIEIDVFLIVWHFSFDDMFFLFVFVFERSISNRATENILINALHIWTCVIVLIFNSHAFFLCFDFVFKAFVRNGMCVTLDKWSD